MSPSVVLITGALTGIGRASAFAFARVGARIVVSGRREEQGQALAGELRSIGVEAEFVLADVRREDDVRSLVDRTFQRFGRLDVAVNSAGTEGKPGPLTEQSQESYAATFDTNVLGTLLSLKHELRVMIGQRSGCIVNLSSTIGKSRRRGRLNVRRQQARRRPEIDQIGGAEAAPFGVRVNAVAPGPVQTELLDRFAGSDDRKAAMANNVPLKRLGKPDEIADAVLFLASAKADFLTGEILHVNGGKTAL